MLIDSWLQPPARSIDGTIDYLSLCNKTSGFIHGVCFILSIWMHKKKKSTRTSVFGSVCLCVRGCDRVCVRCREHRKCVWCASDRAANCSAKKTKKSCCDSSGSVGGNDPRQTLLIKLEMNLRYTAETLYWILHSSFDRFLRLFLITSGLYSLLMAVHGSFVCHVFF